VKIVIVFFVFISLTACGFHHPGVKTLPSTANQTKKILFIAFDGIGYDMMRDLQKEGHFKDFKTVRPPHCSLSLGNDDWIYRNL